MMWVVSGQCVPLRRCPIPLSCTRQRQRLEEGGNHDRDPQCHQKGSKGSICWLCPDVHRPAGSLQRENQPNCKVWQVANHRVKWQLPHVVIQVHITKGAADDQREHEDYDRLAIVCQKQGASPPQYEGWEEVPDVRHVAGEVPSCQVQRLKGDHVQELVFDELWIHHGNDNQWMDNEHPDEGRKDQVGDVTRNIPPSCGTFGRQATDEAQHRHSNHVDSSR
mmetsp:Transcript_69263/g.129328  ORF Transcript_69263/g.129328 Transcript_69263/m.129328 type:complete len:221 (-) Transcript_69263:635-1297(-)